MVSSKQPLQWLVTGQCLIHLRDRNSMYWKPKYVFVTPRPPNTSMPPLGLTLMKTWLTLFHPPTVKLHCLERAQRITDVWVCACGRFVCGYMSAQHMEKTNAFFLSPSHFTSPSANPRSTTLIHRLHRVHNLTWSGLVKYCFLSFILLHLQRMFYTLQWATGTTRDSISEHCCHDIRLTIYQG